MNSVDILRTNLIDKILTIKNTTVLEALDDILSSSQESTVNLSNVQKKMLQLSEDDILSGNLISQDKLDKQDLKWLNE